MFNAKHEPLTREITTMDIAYPPFADGRVMLSRYPGYLDRRNLDVPLSLALIAAPQISRQDSWLPHVQHMRAVINEKRPQARFVLCAEDMHGESRHYLHHVAVTTGLEVVALPTKQLSSLRLGVTDYWLLKIRRHDLKFEHRLALLFANRHTEFRPPHRMYIDVSHMSCAYLLRFLRFLRKEQVRNVAFVSHAGSYAVYKHPRNLCDECLKLIVQLGGVVCLTTTTFHLHEFDNSLEPFRRHLRHVLSVCGADGVGIGSGGMYVDLPYGSMSYYRVKRYFELEFIPMVGDPTLGMRFPDQPEILFARNRMEVLFGAIRDEHGVEIATKVCGKNLIRFFS